MSIRVSGVYLMPSEATPENNNPNENNEPNNQLSSRYHHHHHHHHHHQAKTVTIVAPQRSNSLDYLNFEEKRQIIASSLSLSDFLAHGPAAAAAAAAKEVAANTVVIGKFHFFHSFNFQNSYIFSQITVCRVGLFNPLFQNKIVLRGTTVFNYSCRSKTTY